MRSKESSKNYGRGYLYVVPAAFKWGLSGSSAKFLFNSGIIIASIILLQSNQTQDEKAPSVIRAQSRKE